MQKSETNQTAKNAHRQVKSSTTLNRKYVKRPAGAKSSDMVVKARKSPKISKFSIPVIAADEIAVQDAQVQADTDFTAQAPMVMDYEGQAQTALTETRQSEEVIARHPMQAIANEKMRARMMTSTPIRTERLTAKELKDRAIKKALADASTTASQEQTGKMAKAVKETKEPMKMHFGFGRVLLALTCAAIAVFVIVYFVDLNMPDISLRVAAMQTGIEASYPGYVPRDYSLSEITSENGKISLSFVNHSTNDSFTLTEEKSSWDSNALLTNYVKDTYGENYTTIREQGLTLYISGNSATWVNGGIVYKLTPASGSLTKKQIRSIAVSL